MEETSSLVSHSGTAADVTGMTRVCSDLLCRVGDFVQRVDVIKDNIACVHDCCRLIDKVLTFAFSFSPSLNDRCDTCLLYTSPSPRDS